MLLAKTEAGARPVRLLGVSVHNLSTDEEEAPDSDDPAPSVYFLTTVTFLSSTRSTGASPFNATPSIFSTTSKPLST